MQNSHTIDFAAYDRSAKYAYRDELEARARELGYRYISEMIVKEYVKHPTRTAAANIGRWSKNAILYHIRKLGLPTRPRGGANYKGKYRYTPEQDREITRLFADGLTFRAISKKIGIPVWSVRRRMERLRLLPANDRRKIK